MCKRYPRGKLYDLPDGLGTSLFDPEGRPIAGRLSTRFSDLVLLRRQFPDAKQVIFIPMFHAGLNRWNSCFAFTNSRYRVFSYDMDYLPMLSFSNAIKAEIVRLSTIFADQQKRDFIGSVSHELRSPLHGILASLEFLQDTQCDEFQKSCLNTLDACAHTLLDTVAMVLDYSKVNTLKRKVSNDSGRSSQSQESSTPKATDEGSSGKARNDPLFATDQDCDVALITEEVVDGLATGHFAKHRTNLGFDDQSSGINTSLSDANTNPMLRRIMAAVRPEVELILDIGAPANWSFRTQPGAVRRIVMNLFGNSLKYTKHGYINVTLRVTEAPSNPANRAQSVQFEEKQQAIVKITVSDTGQGISPEYLRSKIFTPFAQENAKSAGTGLGLSIVRSIVHSLGGEIDIKSIVNVGTIVTVTLPMKRPRPVAPQPEVTPVGSVTSASTEIMLLPSESRRQDLSVVALQDLQHSPQAAIYEPTMEHDSFGQTQGAIGIHGSLVQYLTGWFGFPVLQTWDFDLPAQLLIVDESHLPTLLARRPDYLDAPSLQSIIILCANPGRQATLAKDIKGGQVELICKPFGPYKLARALLRALSKASGPINYLEKRNHLHRTPTIHTPQPEPLPRSVDSARLARTDTSTTMASNMSFVSTPGITPCSESAPSTLLQGCQDKPSSAASEGGYPFPSSVRPIASRSVSTRTVETAQHQERPRHLMPPTQSNLPVSTRSAPLSTTRTSPEVTSAAVEATLNRDADSSQQKRKPRVLLVDDNKVNLHLLHTFLGKRGYGPEDCAVAEDGQEAVDVFKAFVPELIFMDISMPVMDGFEATREIRKLEAEARAKQASDVENLTVLEARMCKASQIVALTGNAKGSDQAEAFESGLDLYMTKPVSFKQVGKLLDQWREK